MFLEGQRVRTTWQLVAGIIAASLCAALVVLPDVLPAIVGSPGQVWTPINSQQFRIGDAYYYAAWVAEVLRSGVPPHSPSAAELAGRPMIEATRWLPLAAAALPGFLFNDFRLVYVIDYALSATILFAVPYFLTWRTLGSVRGGIFAGVAVIFFVGQWWSALPIAPGLEAPTNIFAWISSVFSTFWRNAFRTFFDIYETEALQGSFRYINNSVTAPLLLLYALGCYVIYGSRRPNYLTIGSMLVFSPLMAFSYPSRALVAYLVLGGLACCALLRKKHHAAIALISLGGTTVCILLLGGYIGFIRRVFAENELWNNIFKNDSMVLIQRPLTQMIALVTINKYSVSLAAAVWCLWRFRDFRDFTVVVGIVACALVTTGLFDMPLLWHRFLDRGVDHLWFTCLVVALVAGWRELVGKMLPPMAAHRATVLALCAAIAVSVLAFGEYAIASSKNLTRFMPQGRWEAISWVNRNVDRGTVVAALDWDDITFVPIYSSAKLAVGHMIIGGRSPQEEMRRYTAVWKILGLERQALQVRLETMVALHVARRRMSTRQFRNPPLGSHEEYAASQIAEAILYWPYVPSVNGIQIASSREATVVNPALVNWAMSLYDAADPERDLKEMAVRYIMVSGAERNLHPHPVKAARLAFENATHQIFAVAARR